MNSMAKALLATSPSTGTGTTTSTPARRRFSLARSRFDASVYHTHRPPALPRLVVSAACLPVWLWCGWLSRRAYPEVELLLHLVGPGRQHGQQQTVLRVQPRHELHTTHHHKNSTHPQPSINRHRALLSLVCVPAPCPPPPTLAMRSAAAMSALMRASTPRCCTFTAT